MSRKVTFSEISLVYNLHAFSLNEARQAFQEETMRLNQIVQEQLKEIAGRFTAQASTGIAKVRWGTPEDHSSARDVSWLNFLAGIELAVDIRPPGYQIYRKGAAFMYFETRFDDEMKKFVFQVRFENSNSVDAMLDEHLHKVLSENPDKDLPGSYPVKTNTVILCRRELDESLSDAICVVIEKCLRKTIEMVDRVFPDQAYPKG